MPYDAERRLKYRQNGQNGQPITSQACFMYDGRGNRVAQKVTTSGSTTTTYIAGGQEEVTSTGTTMTLTKYFSDPSGLPTAERVGTNGPLSYLATDGQGTVSETLDGSGTVTSAQLYTPYGTTRYSSGSSPTSLGYTGQRADSATGLDYYHARYYDPAAGQFISADTVEDGLNRYGYVAGNPTTNTDPSGHRLWAGGNSGGGGSNIPVDCHVTNTCTTTSGGDNKGGSKGKGCSGNTACSKGSPGKVCDETCKQKKQTDRLNGLTADEGLWLTIAAALQLSAALVAFFTASDIGKKIEFFLTMVEIAIGLLLPGIGLLIQGKRPDLVGVYRTFQFIAAGLSQIAGMLTAAYDVYKNIGWFARAALDAVVFTAQTAAEGIPGALTLVTTEMLGGAASLLLTGLSYMALAQYSAAAGEYDREHAMTPDEWCDFMGSGACTA